MNTIKKIVLAAAAITVTMGMGVSAMAFSDMPDGEMGTALQHAVDAKLMDGVTDDSIAPYDNITRAEMATIIVRAFGASALSDTKFSDVPADEWYAEYVSKAAAMGAFEGDDYNNFNPEDNITFQETYTVLSRMFGFEPYKSSKGMVSDCEESVLNAFSDAAAVEDWAKPYAKYIVGNGGWTGIGGQLKPTSAITRGEFAMVMDKIVDTYVDDQASADSLKGKEVKGAVLVRKGGVKIDGLTTNGNLIIAQGVDETGVAISNSKVNGVTLVLGGVDKTPSPSSNGKILPDESYVSIDGEYYDVRVSTPYVYLNASSAKIDFYKGVEGSLVSLMLQSN